MTHSHRPIHMQPTRFRPGVVSGHFCHFSGQIHPSTTCNLFHNLPLTIPAQDRKVLGQNSRGTLAEHWRYLTTIPQFRRVAPPITTLNLTPLDPGTRPN
ncbi:hypothetical protein PS1_025681 [Malus domestica]